MALTFLNIIKLLWYAYIKIFMLIKELGPFIWFTLEKMIVNHCSTFKINLNRGPQCELYSGLSRNMVHISTEREGKKM